MSMPVDLLDLELEAEEAFVCAFARFGCAPAALVGTREGAHEDSGTVGSCFYMRRERAFMFNQPVDPPPGNVGGRLSWGNIVSQENVIVSRRSCLTPDKTFPALGVSRAV